MPSSSPRSAADFPWRTSGPPSPTAAPSLSPDMHSPLSSDWSDGAVDFEALAFMAATEYDESTFGLSRRASREMAVSGLPLVCSNCGVSFFSLQITDDQVDCYCSGECKWSVIMYREMDRRLCALRPRAAAAAASASAGAGSTYDSSCAGSDACAGSSFRAPVDDVISCR